MAVCIISGLIIFIHSYVTAQDFSEKIKLRWVLLGLIVGPLMYACLWVIPQAITNYGLIPEEFVVIFMLFIPVTFAIAILKHHIFDIDLIIERSLIYFLSIGILILIYASIVSILTNFFKNINEYISSGFAAVIIALLFHPAKEWVQKIINKRFFRIKYDFRIASRKFLDEIKDCNEIQTLAEKIIEQIKILIPVKKQAFFSFSSSNNRVYLIAGENFDILKGRSLFIDQLKLKTNLPRPVALKNKIEPGSPIEEANIDVFIRWGIAMIFPIKSTSDDFLGFLVLGERKSGSRFTVEDLDLLIEVCLQAGLSIERIQIQENLIREKLLKEKLQELNELKSFFISSVSHELKTPLTSIRMFAEFLHFNEDLAKYKKEEYLEIIEGECDRLSRLIENILNLSKIERGVIEFRPSEIDIKALLNHTISLLAYQSKIEKCEIAAKLCEDECILTGDVDLIQS
ncbi:MAG: histidine kinase dimerization/phospho-acceptor domain-containing protein, partial [Ignavibacteriaceae bacterium]